jgi:hypothetical protein
LSLNRPKRDKPRTFQISKAREAHHEARRHEKAAAAKPLIFRSSGFPLSAIFAASLVDQTSEAVLFFSLKSQHHLSARRI